MKHEWIVVGFLFFLLGGGCTPVQEYRYMQGEVYGTFYHISYAWEKELDQEISRAMESVNASLSMFNPQSVISRLNRNETDSTDALFRKMYEEAVWVNQETDGAFDITVAPLVNAWGFGDRKQVFPDSAQIDSLRRWVGMEKLTLAGNRLLKQSPEVMMDASAIAKGLGVDQVADFFDSVGVRNYMVEIGGEIRVKGISDKKRPWRIGIDRPDEQLMDRQLQMITAFTQGALATSGNYRNFYVHEGKKYAHTINPKTGYPVQTEVLSASVYAPTCMVADAYATAFMVLGLKKAQQIILAHPELEGVLIYLEEGNMKTWVSPGFEKMIIRE